MVSDLIDEERRQNSLANEITENAILSLVISLYDLYDVPTRRIQVHVLCGMGITSPSEVMAYLPV